MAAKKKNPAKKFKVTKQLVKELDAMEGTVRGDVFNIDYQLVKKRFGEEGVAKLSKRMKELGHPINYGKTRSTGLYPMGLRVLSILVIKELFNYSEKDIVAYGYDAPKVSFLIKIFVGMFMSIDKVLSRVNDLWQRHYSQGEVKVKSPDMKKKKLVIQVIDFESHPVYCNFLKGYFKQILNLVMPKVKVSVKNKCDPEERFHEFILTWKD